MADLNVSNGIKAALIGGAVTFLFNGITAVWMISTMDTLQDELMRRVKTLETRQEELRLHDSELDVRVSVLETEVDALQAPIQEDTVGRNPNSATFGLGTGRFWLVGQEQGREGQGARAGRTRSGGASGTQGRPECTECSGEGSAGGPDPSGQRTGGAG